MESITEIIKHFDSIFYEKREIKSYRVKGHRYKSEAQHLYGKVSKLWVESPGPKK